jgi:hypothetical protein
VSESHECPIPGCETLIPFDKLLCHPHWCRVPGPLRRRVLATWRERLRATRLFRARALPQERYLEAARAHQDACDAAIEAVAQHLAGRRPVARA